MENILTLGDSIYDELKTKNPSAKSITSVDMDKYKLQIETKKLIVGVEIMTLSGTIYSKEPSILSLKVALEQFFNHYNAGVMETKALVVAVWKDGDVFYMFQPYQCDNTGKRIMEEKKPEVKAGDDKKSGGKKKEKKEKKVSKELEPDKKTGVYISLFTFFKSVYIFNIIVFILDVIFYCLCFDLCLHFHLNVYV